MLKRLLGVKRHVLGALHAITHEVILVTNDTYITATQVCELWSKIAALGVLQFALRLRGIPVLCLVQTECKLEYS